MSSDLNIYVRKKKYRKKEDPYNHEDMTCVLYYSTTRTRELSGEGLIDYTYHEDDEKNHFTKDLTIEMINNIIEYYDNEIRICKDNIAEAKQRIQDIHDLTVKNEGYGLNGKINITVYSIKDTEVFDTLIDEINNQRGAIVYYEEEIEELTSRKYDFIFLKNMYEDNYDFDAHAHTIEFFYTAD